MVKFCPQCNNIFSHQIDNQTYKLKYTCFTCGKTEDVVDHCITVNELDTKTQDYALNPNMIYDKTLLRTNKIPCPDPICNQDQNGTGEIIKFQYNPNTYKSAYMCTKCQIYWKN